MYNIIRYTYIFLFGFEFAIAFVARVCYYNNVKLCFLDLK